MRYILVLITLFLLYACNPTPRKNTEESKEEADTREIKKRTVDRPTYTLQYYKDWNLDTTDTDFDIDAYFVLNSPSESGFNSLFLFNTGIDEEMHVNMQTEAHLKKTMKGAEVTRFTKWGNFTGHGVILKGKITGIWKGELKVFAHSGEDLSFVNVSQLIYSDSAKDARGIRLIESSLRLKNSPSSSSLRGGTTKQSP
ncbi:MAG: hypothetical protein IPP31_02555 [Chitinophagaceae bacterium]|nr:hypothetical protein [Chitinophagaceae bacterium]